MDVSVEASLRFCLMTLSQWSCRICGFDRFHRVSVLRKTGVRYETPFHACSGCSAIFLNTSQFDANSTAAPNIEAPSAVVTPMRRHR
jgi:hypothetical protein